MKSVCFAYFADGKFIGWYGGTFGPVSDSPKVYSSLESMRATITKNLSHKLKKINETSFDEAKGTATGLAAFGLLEFSGEDELRGKDVELRVVECPEYDGPNPDFDEEEFDKLSKAHTVLVLEHLKSLGISTDGHSPERTKAVIDFTKLNPSPKSNNWIYCDYNKVIEWAKNEPTEFIDVIKPLYGEPV